MSKLNNTIRLAFSAAMVAGFALPYAAMAQGRGHDKDKHDKKGEKVEKMEDNHDRKHDDDNERDENRKVRTSSVTVQPITQGQRIPPGQAKKHVTTPQAVLVTRDVLVSNGYQVTQVVQSGTSQIIYYRRGNMGQGRGLGPIERIVVVPAGQVVRFQSVPQPLLATILSRLGIGM